MPDAAGVHDRVRGFAGGDQRDAGHGAVRPVPGDPDRVHGDQQHGPDHDRGQRGHMRHRADRRRRVHSGQQAPRQEAAHAARLGRVLSPEQGRRSARRRHVARQLLRRRQRRPLQPVAHVVAGRPKRVQRRRRGRPQGLGPGLDVQQPQSKPKPYVPGRRQQTG